jgi:hypothetical protein
METNLAIQEYPNIDWTIKDQLNSRAEGRNKWDNDFMGNYVEVADKISESIEKEVFEKIQQDLPDPYKPLPTYSHPCHLSYSLEMGRPMNILKIKKWASEKSQLPPFNEWFQTLEKQKQESPEFASSISIYSHNNSEVEISYFQNRMALIGQKIEKSVKNTLSNYVQKPGNTALKFKVEWYRKADKIISNPSNFHDNCLSIDLWIDEGNETKKNTRPSLLESRASSKKPWYCTVS